MAQALDCGDDVLAIEDARRSSFQSAMSCPVLLIEREAETRWLIRAVLALRGIHEVDEARDAAEALHKIASKRYGLVLLDATLPDGSGIDLLYSLAALARGLTGATPLLADVIVLTALPAEELASGRLVTIAPGTVKAVVRKPIEVWKLSNVIAPYASAGCDDRVSA